MILRVDIWTKAIRITAIYLLLLVTAQVLVCDLWRSDHRYVSSKSLNLNNNHADGSSDDSECWCQHMAVAMPIAFKTIDTVAPPPPEKSVQKPIHIPASIEHPPELA
jgi:hypothetical protein